MWCPLQILGNKTQDKENGNWDAKAFSRDKNLRGSFYITQDCTSWRQDKQDKQTNKVKKKERKKERKKEKKTNIIRIIKKNKRCDSEPE